MACFINLVSDFKFVFEPLIDMLLAEEIPWSSQKMFKIGLKKLFAKEEINAGQYVGLDLLFIVTVFWSSLETDQGLLKENIMNEGNKLPQRIACPPWRVTWKSLDLTVCRKSIYIVYTPVPASVYLLFYFEKINSSLSWAACKISCFFSSFPLPASHFIWFLKEM